MPIPGPIPEVGLDYCDWPQCSGEAGKGQPASKVRGPPSSDWVPTSVRTPFRSFSGNGG